MTLRTVLLTLAALTAFAANSVLCRAALSGPDPDPAAFTALRLASGAAALAGLMALRGGGRIAAPPAASALALLAYAGLFSVAYLALPAGLGALILFGAVQISMFAGGLIGGERPAPMRWLGAGCGLAGLAVLAAPGAEAPPAGSAALMAGAGIAWGIYSLRGRGSSRPLADTAAAFVAAAPAAIALWLAALALGAAPGLGAREAGLAVLSGALASGCGYAVWYTALPRLDASMAAVAQLAVPLIALGGGMAFLGEAPTWRFAAAAALILGGLGAALAPRRTR